MQNTAKQNYPVSIAFYNTRPGNEVGLFYNAFEPHGGTYIIIIINNNNKTFVNSASLKKKTKFRCAAVTCNSVVGAVELK